MDIEVSLNKTDYPNYIKEYIKEVHDLDPIQFIKAKRKAEQNSKRTGFNKYDLWIAANNSRVIQLNGHYCYYCHLDLNNVSPDLVRFEHYYPKKQEPSNIVPACKWCDEFKRDRTPEDFEKIICNRSIVKHDRYAHSKDSRRKLIEFAPLVASHSLGSSNNIWIKYMIDIAKENYKIDLCNIHEGQVRWKYYELYRSHWLPQISPT